MRGPIALLAAVVAGMAMVAAGLVGGHFGFHNWPMAPVPESAQHVTVEHDTLAGGSGRSERSKPGEPRHHKAAGGATEARRSTAPRVQNTYVSQRPQRFGRLPGGRRSGGHSGSGDRHGGRGDGSGSGSGNSGSTTPAPGSDSGSSGGSTPTTTTPAAGPSTTPEVTPAAAAPEPAATTPAPAPAEPQPATPEPTTPTPAPETPGSGDETGDHDGDHHGGGGHHRGPVRQLLHDLLGHRKIQG
jgi:hypothetical protein